MAKRSPPQRPDKLTNVLGVARKCMLAGLYLITEHADKRMGERKVTLPEIKKVIGNGYHEKRKDQFKSEYGGWGYAIRGNTIDNRDLRVVVAFEAATQMLVVTVIELDSEGEA